MLPYPSEPPPLFLAEIHKEAYFCGVLGQQLLPDAPGHFATRPRPERTTLHYVAANLEDRILAEAEEFLTSRGVEVSSIHFDGLLARHVDPVSLEELVYRVNVHVADALGYKVEFVVKKWPGGFMGP